ncbi:LacI family transcriptional regulator [Tessaracoccus sp. HDW20]|uniref:substrate-binding domain-containing protein n=1 Tax=Tessaracoccus coleopterorum TaxID=2714950 RepID=UPI0018D368B7|nr:LacI family transcriptional regulator [Tessaracoccus coleopterorum]
MLWPIPHDDTRMMSSLVAQGQADGVLMMSVHLDDARADALDAAGVPYAMIGATRDISSRSSVDIDFGTTVQETVDRLVGLGHREIAFINHSSQSLATGYGPSVRADQAYRAYLTDLGLSPIARTCEDTPSAGRQVAAEILDSHPGVTSFMTMNELATFGVYSALQSRGLSIPGDVSIIGLATSMGVSEMSNPHSPRWMFPAQPSGASPSTRSWRNSTANRPRLPTPQSPASTARE